jgi:hypothetical protein
MPKVEVLHKFDYSMEFRAAQRAMQRIIEDIRKDLEEERKRKAENEACIVEANKHKPPRI